MTDSDVLSPFDDAVIRAVAAENSIEERQLRTALADHQETMRVNPGVEDLVYEWRKRFDDALLGRTPETYYLGVRRGVWDEFGSYLDFDDYLLAAVVAVHQEQVLRADAVDSRSLDAESVAIVVARP